MSNFTDVAAQVKNLKTKPSDNDLLKLYGLYKQAIVGDINIDRPGAVDLKGKAKWDAWNERKGMSKEDAEKEYVTAANELIKTIGVN